MVEKGVIVLVGDLAGNIQSLPELFGCNLLARGSSCGQREGWQIQSYRVSDIEEARRALREYEEGTVSIFFPENGNYRDFILFYPKGRKTQATIWACAKVVNSLP